MLLDVCLLGKRSIVEIFILEWYEDGEEYGGVVVKDFVGTSMGVGSV